MLDLTENIYPLITDRAMKAKIKLLTNLLFKTLPPTKFIHIKKKIFNQHELKYYTVEYKRTS